MENYELKFLEEQIYRKKAQIPKGKKKIISCRLYPDSNNIFWINDVLKKYSSAVLSCSWHFTGHGVKYIELKILSAQENYQDLKATLVLSY